MAKIKINKQRCKGCGLCILFCPKKNLRKSAEINGAGLFPAEIISQENCTGCGICYLMCPDSCIEVES